MMVVMFENDYICTYVRTCQYFFICEGGWEGDLVTGYRRHRTNYFDDDDDDGGDDDGDVWEWLYMYVNIYRFTYIYMYINVYSNTCSRM
jgi:hypothetical protein